MTAAQPPLQDIATLYGEHHAWLFGWLRRKLGCAHHAADVAQDTFMRLLTVNDALPPLAEPRAFLTTTAQRLLIDRGRRHQLEEAYRRELQALADDLPYHPSPEEILQAVQVLARIAAVLDDLPVKPRTAFMLHYVDGATHADIARQLGVSTRMVHKYLVQALLRCDEACR